MRQDDPDVVRREYADDSRLAAPQSIWARRTGPNVFDVAFAPRRVLTADDTAAFVASNVP